VKLDAETAAVKAARRAETVGLDRMQTARGSALLRDLRGGVVAAEDGVLSGRLDDAMAELEWLRLELRYLIDLVEGRKPPYDPAPARARWAAHYSSPAERLPKDPVPGCHSRPRPTRKPGPPVIPPATPR
jgi:hypothetical protein